MKMLLPILLMLLGTGAGVGAGYFLRPAPEPADHATADTHPEADVHAATDPHAETLPKPRPAVSAPPSERDYVKMSNQFVIPVVQDGAVASLVVMSLSVETDPEYADEIFRIEPKLRDSFLQVLFDHANVGGFRGAFTDVSNLEVLRAALREVAIRDAGDHVSDVLILDIARQDY